MLSGELRTLKANLESGKEVTGSVRSSNWYEDLVNLSIRPFCGLDGGKIAHDDELTLIFDVFVKYVDKIDSTILKKLISSIVRTSIASHKRALNEQAITKKVMRVNNGEGFLKILLEDVLKKQQLKPEQKALLKDDSKMDIVKDTYSKVTGLVSSGSIDSGSESGSEFGSDIVSGYSCDPILEPQKDRNGVGYDIEYVC